MSYHENDYKDQARRPQVYRCQFCDAISPAKSWKYDKCPQCGSEYSWLLAQDSD